MRFFLTLLFVLALSIPAEAQQPKKVPRVGVLAPGTPANTEEALSPFRQRLHELGYVEGKNIIFEYRWGEGNIDRLPVLAADLVRLKVDVIFTMSTPVAMAAKDATTTIPIVVTSLSDPVATGLVEQRTIPESVLCRASSSLTRTRARLPRPL
jgi:putative ABC transport system substrate-binding protein